MKPMSQVTPDQVNHLNGHLMLVSAGLASWHPFEVLLFVYRCSGRLTTSRRSPGCTTRHYFTIGKHDCVFLTVVSVVVTTLSLS